MADRYLLESGSPDGYLLEDGSGVLLLEVPPVTWNTTAGVNKNSKVTVSSDGFTETPDNVTSTFQTVRTNQPTTVNAVQFEGTLDTAGTPLNVTVGFDNGTTDLSVDGNLPGSTDSNGVGIELFGTNWYIIRNGGVSQGPFASPSPASSQIVTGIANRTSGTASFFVNGAQIGVTETGITFTDWYVFGSGKGDGAQGAVVANFAGPFTYPQTGYSAYDAGGASPDVTVALTGQSLAGTLGSILAAASLALSGGALSSSQGNLGRGAALTGQSVAAAQGTTAPVTSVALTGQALSVARGTTAPATANVLAGQPAAAAQGSLTAAPSIGLTGQAASIAQGSVNAGSDATAALTGQALSSAQGSVVQTIPVALTGQSLTVARGTLAPAATGTITGQATSVALGLLAPAASVAISGQGLTAASGTITVAGSSNVTASLTGVSLAAAQGLASPSTTAGLTGQASPVALGSIARSLSLNLSGQGAVVAYGTITPATALALGGQAVSIGQGILAPTSSLGIVGQQTNLVQGTTIVAADHPPVVTPANRRIDTENRSGRTVAGTPRSRRAAPNLQPRRAAG